MKIAITGAGGLVGSSLNKLLSKNHQVLALRHADLDITNNEAVQKFAAAEAPDVIINCAVLNVDECETDREKAYNLNVAGPKYLSEAARNCGAAIVHYSTNYVFDGKTEKIYTINVRGSPCRRTEPTFTAIFGSRSTCRRISGCAPSNCGLRRRE